jgi:RNA polymerase sigma-54 factor
LLESQKLLVEEAEQLLKEANEAYPIDGYKHLHFETIDEDGILFRGEKSVCDYIETYEFYIEPKLLFNQCYREDYLNRRKGIYEKYLTALSDPNMDQETKQYLESQLDSAKALIHQLKNRYESTEKLVRFLVERQTLFFEKGPLFLTPLLQCDVAKALGRDPSTISRLVSSKYIYTPQGVIQLKQLCPRNHCGRTARQLAAMVKRAIETDPQLSDSQIAKKLSAQGIKIARRTVNKYRWMEA